MVEIENAHLLVDVFGHWPDFHDAELRTLRLDAMGADGAMLEVEIEVAEMSSEIDERGYYRDRRRCRAMLHFGNVLDASVVGFRYQNVLEALEVTELNPEERQTAEPWGERRYRVRFIPIPAFCEVEFLCDSMSVVTVTPVVPAS
jgi:hypothetical protein